MKHCSIEDKTGDFFDSDDLKNFAAHQLERSQRSKSFEIVCSGALLALRPPVNFHCRHPRATFQELWADPGFPQGSYRGVANMAVTFTSHHGTDALSPLFDVHPASVTPARTVAVVRDARDEAEHGRCNTQCLAPISVLLCTQVELLLQIEAKLLDLVVARLRSR